MHTAGSGTCDPYKDLVRTKDKLIKETHPLVAGDNLIPVDNGTKATLKKGGGKQILQIDLSIFHRMPDQIEKLTIVELAFQNVRSLTFHNALYNKERAKYLLLPSFGNQPANIFEVEGELTIFLIQENRINLQTLSTLNPNAYVITIPNARVLENKSYNQLLMNAVVFPSDETEAMSLNVTIHEI